MTLPGRAALEAETSTLELRAASFRDSSGGVTAALSLESRARRIGLIGAWGSLFRVLTGEVAIASGACRILGCDAPRALAGGVVGMALLDPPLPESFSVREYLEHGAQLSHGSRARAREEAQRALDTFELTELAPTKLAALAPFQRRALGIALAALGSPAVLFLEAPLHGLDSASADFVSRLCAHAAERARLVVSSSLPSTPSAERTLLGNCDELFLLGEGALVAHGAPSVVFAPGSRYLLTCVGASSAKFERTLSESGCTLTELRREPTLGPLLAANARAVRYLIEVPEAASSDLLLDAALATGVTVLELEPLVGSH